MNGCPLRRNGRMRIVRKPGRRVALPFVGSDGADPAATQARAGRLWLLSGRCAGSRNMERLRGDATGRLRRFFAGMGAKHGCIRRAGVIR